MHVSPSRSRACRAWRRSCGARPRRCAGWRASSPRRARRRCRRTGRGCRPREDHRRPAVVDHLPIPQVKRNTQHDAAAVDRQTPVTEMQAEQVRIGLLVRRLPFDGDRIPRASPATDRVLRDAADLSDHAVGVSAGENRSGGGAIRLTPRHEHMFAFRPDGIAVTASRNGGPRNRTWRGGFGDRSVTDTPVPLAAAHCRWQRRINRPARTTPVLRSLP